MFHNSYFERKNDKVLTLNIAQSLIPILNNASEDQSTNVTMKYLKNFTNLFSAASNSIQIKRKCNFYEAINARKQRFLKNH